MDLASGLIISRTTTCTNRSTYMLEKESEMIGQIWEIVGWDEMMPPPRAVAIRIARIRNCVSGPPRDFDVSQCAGLKLCTARILDIFYDPGLLRNLAPAVTRTSMRQEPGSGGHHQAHQWRCSINDHSKVLRTIDLVSPSSS